MTCLSEPSLPSTLLGTLKDLMEIYAENCSESSRKKQKYPIVKVEPKISIG